MKEIPRHPSMRGEFSYQLALQMEKDPDIWVVSCDLGYGMFDYIRDTYPDRFINVGAAEQAGMGIAVGLALEGKKPFVYSITTFLLYRPFETIRNYIDHEKISVRLVGGGRDKDYHIDGFSHWSEDAYNIFGGSQNLYGFFQNIQSLWPNEKEEIEDCVKLMVDNDRPTFISLRR